MRREGRAEGGEGSKGEGGDGREDSVGKGLGVVDVKEEEEVAEVKRRK